jgi:hypothetical protein
MNPVSNFFGLESRLQAVLNPQTAEGGTPTQTVLSNYNQTLAIPYTCGNLWQGP